MNRGFVVMDPGPAFGLSGMTSGADRDLSHLHVRAAQEFPARRSFARIDLKVAPAGARVHHRPSGSGKSTLLRCCNRLEEPTGGGITFDGVDLMARTTTHAMRRRIGWCSSPSISPANDRARDVTLALRKWVGNRAPRPIAGHGGARPRRALRRKRILSVDVRGPAVCRDARALALGPCRDAVRRTDLRARSGAGRLGTRGDA